MWPFILIFGASAGLAAVLADEDRRRRKADMMDDIKRLNLLRPEVRDKVLELGALLKAKYGIGISVGTTLRTAAESEEKVKAGLASATLSADWHRWGRAIDLYLLDSKGKRIIPRTADEKAKYMVMAQEAEAMGFRQIGWNKDAAGKWTPKMIKGVKGAIWDCFHLEWRGSYKTTAELVKAEKPMA